MAQNWSFAIAFRGHDLKTRGLTLAQLSLAWLLVRSRVNCVLVGAKNPRRVKELVWTADVYLDASELAELERILDTSHPTEERS